MNDNPKYYYWDKRTESYHILKKINGKMIGFGYYPNKSVAQFIVNELIKCNWQKSHLPHIRKVAFTKICNGELK